MNPDRVRPHTTNSAPMAAMITPQTMLLVLLQISVGRFLLSLAGNVLGKTAGCCAALAYAARATAVMAPR